MPEKEPWQWQFYLPFSSEYEIAIGCDKWLFSMKARKKSLLFIPSDCHFNILGFPFQNTAGLGLERRRKGRKNTAGRILSRWSFSLLHLLFVKYHLICFEKWMLKPRSSIHKCHKYFSKYFQVGNTGMFLRYFISQKAKKPKLPTKPPSVMIFLLSTLANSLCL